ncbi:MAG: GNAT family N-acetyltransferase [Deltaproteobacteria bacterium]|nr:GNAT family N-acetyltransferase [Deltaproteobacteria bacterium]MBW1923314.1 GNAT family N-acetyltransferase [Deltaproteobacteria bacterium]MBW1950023.1 GNAT family N-acetyltransferase [Deltaproteobacteria bacterium]MBW2007922.1 GNAT family N-acetyltransferase [Deltaproteobacteria bacterium]MBW2103740.1 GNAT family N-acetyltransferase [Deltaproteobacteria bacterium]
MENLRIRKVTVEDAPDIARIENAIMQSPTGSDFAKIIRDQIHEGEDAGFVAEVDGRLAGYMISYSIYAGFGLDKSAWIATFGVAPRYMGRGIGKKLAEATLEHYRKRGVKHILTSVRWDSVDLLSFFKTLGFDRSDFINVMKKLD